MKDKQNYYTIGEISDICDIPIKTLRYYDEIGLLTPTMRNKDNNYRYYNDEQILTLYIIKKLKFFGFSLEEIKTMTFCKDVKTVTNHLRERTSVIKGKIENLNVILCDLENMLSRLEKGNSFIHCFDKEDMASEKIEFDDSDVFIEEIPRYNCIYTRAIQKNYDNAGVTIPRWFELFDIAKKLRLNAIGVVLCTYHNEPLGQFVNKECDLEISTPVYGAVNSPHFKESGGYKAVTAFHSGSHATLITTHIKMIKWINNHKLNISGPISEEYIISPLDVTNEDDFVTKVIIPIG